MRFWRTSRFASHAKAFDGEGARRYPGRWNTAGVPVVYASSSLSLAALELLVHLDIRHSRVPLHSFAIDIPPRLVETPARASLPPSWNDLLHPAAAQAFGTAWALGLRSLALRVPSVVVPSERNLILNPAHPAFSRIEIAGPEPFAFDPRLPGPGAPARRKRRTR